MLMKPIQNHPGYFARIDGQILSYWTRGQNAHIGQIGRVLRPSFAGRGYLKVQVRVKANVYETKYLHRLVCEAFFGMPSEADLQVRHLDGNKTNNKPLNLCWGTAAENGADSVRLGQTTKGERNTQAKLTVETVKAVRQRYAASGLPQHKIGSEFGITQSAVSAAVNGKTWGHV